MVVKKCAEAVTPKLVTTIVICKIVHIVRKKNLYLTNN